MKYQIQGMCPFCDSENGNYSAWGMSPESWEAMRKAHDEGHPTPSLICGGSTPNPAPDKEAEKKKTWKEYDGKVICMGTGYFKKLLAQQKQEAYEKGYQVARDRYRQREALAKLKSKLVK